jgi:hypothetical protein
VSRLFNGGTSLDMLTFAVGNAPPDQGPITMAVLAKATGVSTNTSYMLQGVATTTPVYSLFFSNNAGGKLFVEGDFGAGGAGLTTDWAWYVATKPPSSALPRFHVKDLVTNSAFTHANGTFAVGDGSGPITSLLIGSNNNLGTTFRGSIAAVVLIAAELTDSGVETTFTYAYADALSAAAGNGWAIRLNQASTATTVIDDTGGGGNQTAISNTSIDVDDPPGFNYALTNTPQVGYTPPDFWPGDGPNAPSRFVDNLWQDTTQPPPPTGPVEVGTTAYTTANATTVTTASFTPANSTLLVAYCSMGNGAAGASSLGAVTDSLGGTWTRLSGEASASGGVAETWARDIATGAAMTVIYDPGGAGASGLDLICKWYSGAKPVAQQPGAIAVNGGTTSYATSITTTAAGSLVVGALGRASDAQTVVANGSTTLLGQVNGSSGDTAALFRATNLTVTPGPTSLGFTNTPAGVNRMALAELLPASGSALTADAVLAVTATISISAALSTTSSATIATAATIAAAASAGPQAAGSLSVTATISTAAARTVPADSSLAVVATLAAAATLNASASAGLTVTTTLTAAATRNAPATGSLAVTATIATSAASNQLAGATLPVTASLTTSTTRSVPSDAVLAVTAALVTAASATGGSVALLPITASISTAATLVAAAAASVATTATLATTATVNRPATASLPITATLTTAAARNAPIAAAVATTATISTAATLATSAASAIAITATITAAAVVGAAPVIANASLAVTASLATSAVAVYSATASVFATATLSTSVARNAPVTASLPVVAALSTSAVLATSSTAALAVTATLAAAASTGAVSSLAITATLAAAAARNMPGPAALNITVTTSTAAALNVRVAGALAVTATIAAGPTIVARTSAALTVLVTLLANATVIPLLGPSAPGPRLRTGTRSALLATTNTARQLATSGRHRPLRTDTRED